MFMKKYTVTGMTCAACSARVEKAVSAVEGVESCSVSLLTESMAVEGNATDEKIISAVRKAGYGAFIYGAESSKASDSDKLSDTQTPTIFKRLIFSFLLLAVLMYFSMGHTMFHFPLPALLKGNCIAVGIIQLLLSLTVMLINRRFFISGFKAVLNRSANMDTLVALGSSASFIYSVCILFAMTKAQADGALDAVASYSGEFYFESAAMILVLITVGKLLEARSKGKTTDALRGLMNLAPKTAILFKDGVEVETEASEIKKGDVFILKPGMAVPADGVIVDGYTAVDESSLTGESIPVDKIKGDSVSAGTFNKSGFVRCEASRVGEDTTLSQIIKTVSDAAATKAPIAKLADKVSGVFVPAVILIALITFIVWLTLGYGVGFSLTRAVSVLVISCPCALGLATPVAVMVGSGVGAKKGIYFKTAASLEEAGKVDIVVLDKTGTVTTGEPTVTDILPADGVSAHELLSLAFSLESKSEHPLAKAVTDKAEELNADADECDLFESKTGRGVSGKVGGMNAVGGNLEFVEEFCAVPVEAKRSAAQLADSGKTPLFFAKGNHFSGVIAVADIIKPESPSTVKDLKEMGLEVLMLTGDNERTAKTIACEIGADDVIAGVLPVGKERIIKKLQNKGKVIMVGDGINDSPALIRADIGMAIGSGADIAVDSADVVLVGSKLSDVPKAIKLSRATLKNIRQNLFWAFIYNIIGIPLAAGVWYPVFGILLNPMFGAAAMSLSSFCVVSNALRLNVINIESSKYNKKIKNKRKKEVVLMTKTVNIKGMMCPHCEARVKKLFESMPQVDEAVVSHANGTAILTLNSELADSAIKSAIEAEGYKVTD